MTKITQVFRNSFEKIKKSLTQSSEEKETKDGYYSKNVTTQEISSQTQESTIETSRSIHSAVSSTSKDNKEGIKPITKPKPGLGVNSQDINKENTSKNEDKKPKTITKNSSNSISSEKQVTYPSGKIVNSTLLNEVEKGYLELAGFKNYKDAFLGLNTSRKRSEVAKKVVSQTSTLTSILKKLELLQVKGVGENTAFVLSQVGINSLKKLQEADVEKVSKKINTYTKKHSDVDVKISMNQLKRFSKDAIEVPSSF